MTVVSPRPRSRPPIDPRVRARRVAVRRAAGRRRLRVVLVVAVAAGMVGGAYGVTRSALLDVDDIIITGATETTRDDVLAATGLGGRPQLADLEPRLLARRVEALPWVDTATVTRHWPGSVDVRLTERQPVAGVTAGEGVVALTDADGRVLAHGPNAAGLPTVTPAASPPSDAGATVDPATLGALRLLDALSADLSGRVRTVTVDTTGELVVSLTGVAPVRFGPPRQIRQKLVALATLLEKADLRRVSAIDVRVPTAPVLTRP